MAALRDRDNLRELSTDDQLMVLRLLVDRRDELSRSRAQGLNRLHRLMTEPAVTDLAAAVLARRAIAGQALACP